MDKIDRRMCRSRPGCTLNPRRGSRLGRSSVGRLGDVDNGGGRPLRCHGNLCSPSLITRKLWFANLCHCIPRFFFGGSNLTAHFCCPTAFDPIFITHLPTTIIPVMADIQAIGQLLDTSLIPQHNKDGNGRPPLSPSSMFEAGFARY